MQLMTRKEYLDWLCRWQDKQIIKVVSGVRRCGKSTLFTLFKQNLLKQGVDEKQIISINLEAMEFEALRDYHTLYQYINNRLQQDCKMRYSIARNIKKLSTACSLKIIAIYILQVPTLILCPESWQPFFPADTLN